MKLSYPLDYSYPPHRQKPPPVDQYTDRVQRGPARSLLDWGAHQVKWRRPVITTYPNLSQYPEKPNTEGLRAFSFRDTETNAFYSNRNHHWYTPAVSDIRSTPYDWGEKQLQ